MNQIKKNFIYNVFYQLIRIIIPIITVPYVSRILLPSGVGIYSYTYSIVDYFMLFALLGINNYGNRSIAKVRDDKEKLSKTFFGIYSIQVIMTILMLIIYLIYVLCFDNQYKIVALIQTIYIISTLFDINWFFFGLEKFKLTVTRSTLVKLISLVLIFILVKNESDVWLYTLILSLSTLISQILLLPFLRKEIKLVKINKDDIIKHIKPCLMLFIPVIAISLYKVMDKIMIGLMSDISEVGYYEQVEKIINVPLSIITALGTVMLPRISNLVVKKDEEQILKYIDKSVNFMMFLAFPITFGLIAVSSNFIPLFLGDMFEKSIYLMYFLAPTIIFISFANILRTQYLIPKEKDDIYIKSVVFGAVLNLIINYIFIPKYASIGACFGTIMAEFFVMLYQMIKLRDYLPLNTYFKEILPYLFKSCIMFIIILFIKFINISSIYILILQVICGVIVYFLLNIKYIKSLLNK